MIVGDLFSGSGLIRADWALSVLVMAAAAMSWWNIAYRGHSAGAWMIAMGFSLLGVRMILTLITGGDPPISPIGIVSLSLISFGWVLSVRRRRRCEATIDPLEAGL
jgi:hypothetical protein